MESLVYQEDQGLEVAKDLKAQMVLLGTVVLPDEKDKEEQLV
jgi:hypothetical protein